MAEHLRCARAAGMEAVAEQVAREAAAVGKAVEEDVLPAAREATAVALGAVEADTGCSTTAP